MSYCKYLKYIGRKGIYFERGCVLSIEITYVTPMEGDQEGAVFTMAIDRSIHQRGTFFDQDDVGYLKVSSNCIDEADDVLRASGYVVWTIVLNETKLVELRQAFEEHKSYVEETDCPEAYGISQKIMWRVPVLN